MTAAGHTARPTLAPLRLSPAATRFTRAISSTSVASKDDGPPQGKLLIAFTCNKCGQRSHKTFSRLAYETGVVIVKCDGCASNHLIADNKGWFRDGKVTVEDLVKESGGDVSGQEALEAADMDELQKIHDLIQKSIDEPKK